MGYWLVIELKFVTNQTSYITGASVWSFRRRIGTESCRFVGSRCSGSSAVPASGSGSGSGSKSSCSRMRASVGVRVRVGVGVKVVMQ